MVPLASTVPLAVGAALPRGRLQYAAIPAAAVTARSLAQISPAAGVVAWGCTGLLAFTVVYLGEHYVIDVIAGLALAEAVWRAEPAMLPLVRIGLGVLRELERRVSVSYTDRRCFSQPFGQGKIGQARDANRT